MRRALRKASVGWPPGKFRQRTAIAMCVLLAGNNVVSKERFAQLLQSPLVQGAPSKEVADQIYTLFVPVRALSSPFPPVRPPASETHQTREGRDTRGVLKPHLL